MADRDLKTIKIPRVTDADPEDVGAAGYEFHEADYQADAVHGYELHRQRRDALGITWLEYINDQAPLLEALEPSGVELEQSIHDISRQVVDDLEGHVRQAAYQGSREALQERR